jgi:phosphoribosylglycinamide formyltransferase-1
MSRKKIAVLISGNGSNLQALIDSCSDKNFPAEIILVLSNKSSAYGLERAKNAGIKTAVLSHQDFKSREEYDRAMDAEIRKSGAEIICMAGFMRLLSPWFVETWHNRLLNIHPSLLPAFKGLHAQRQALEAKVLIAGCTVHLVRAAMDEGPILAQAAVPVFADDSEESLTNRILEQEHLCYSLALKRLISADFSIANEIINFSIKPEKPTAKNLFYTR